MARLPALSEFLNVGALIIRVGFGGGGGYIMLYEPQNPILIIKAPMASVVVGLGLKV